MEPHSVDLLYLACNRLEFTQETFTALLANTDWDLIHELVVCDDGSTDGTDAWLSKAINRVPAKARFVQTCFGSPVTAMGHFIETTSAPILAKCDNDAMYPPGWLRESLAVLDRHQELALLGIEAMYPHRSGGNLDRSYTPAEFISGLGLYRRTAFRTGRPRAYQKWFGLEEWQTAHGAGLIRGWITPALPVFLLDRFPHPPWSEYSERYIECGWQRRWPRYDPTSTLWHWRWAPGDPATPAQATTAKRSDLRCTSAKRSELRCTEPVDAGSAAESFSVVILSARAENLVPCVQSILMHEPAISPSQIIVVDDGARSGAEPLLPPVHWVHGEKPFIFARNANLGIQAAGSDVILLNDDARLMTPQGFTNLTRLARAVPQIGVCSAAIRGIVGNPRQLPRSHGGLRPESNSLAFVCVFIPAAVYAQVGPLDERFNGYGFEDNDYCTRVQAAGLQLAIADGCVVDHGGTLPSTFRTRTDVAARFEHNRLLYLEKWGRSP